MQLRYGLLGLLSLSTVSLGNGFYIGGDVGHEWFVDYKNFTATFVVNGNVSTNITATGVEDWPLGAHVGYHFDVGQRGLLDLQIGAQWLPAKYPYFVDITTPDTSTVLRYSASRSFTFLVLPGMEYHDVSYQVLFGAALTKFTFENDSSPFVSSISGPPYTKSANPGVLVGAKVSTGIDPSLPGLKLSGTYYYSYYKTIDSKRTATVGGNPVAVNTTDQFQGQTALLGLDYVFGTQVRRPYAYGSANALPRFYLGGEFGYNYTIVNRATSETDGTFTNQTNALQGVIGGVYGGDVLFSSQEDHLNISLEGFYHVSDSSVYDVTSDVTQALNYKLGQSYGFTLNPGIWLSHNYLLYALVGPMWADVKNGGNFPRLNGRGFDRTVMGLRVGAGVSMNIYNGDKGRQLRLRMQYAYGDMSSVKLVDPDGDSIRYRFSLNDYTLGLGYYF